MNINDVKQGPRTYNGVFRAVAVTPERKIVTDLRDMIAHFDNDGNVNLIGEYHAGYVEVCLRWDYIERLYNQAKRRREQVTP